MEIPFLKDMDIAREFQENEAAWRLRKAGKSDDPVAKLHTASGKVASSKESLERICTNTYQY